MNQIKKKNLFKFQKPIRKNSDDFDDSDFDIDSDFSLDNDINNNNIIEIDNGKPKNEIQLLKKGLGYLKEEENNYHIKGKSEDNNITNNENDELYSDIEDLEQEDNNKDDIIDKDSEKFQSNDKISRNCDNNDKDDINFNNNLSKLKTEEIEEIEKNEKIEKALINSIENKEKITKENINLAESIQFRNEPDKIIITDDYGFIKKQNKKNTKIVESSDEKKDKNESSKSIKKLLQVNARLEKWTYMIDNYKEFSTNKKKRMLLKSRTRKGIPDSFRGYVWQLFANKERYYVKDLYQSLEKEPIKEDLETVILKDLDRTFPLCQFFREKYGNGQRKLYKVLSAYSKYNKSVGYVQGMGFITAIFLIYMDEESAFYMLHSLMKKYKLEGLYYEGFPDLKKKCYVFLNLQKKYINNIYNIFKRDGIIPSMFLSSWFISLFSRTLAFHIVLRIYDCFFLEGFKVIYRIALAILKLNEKSFSAFKSGEVLPFIYKCHENLDVEELFKVAFGFSISRNNIDKWEEDFEKVKDDKENEFIKQICW